MRLSFKYLFVMFFVCTGVARSQTDFFQLYKHIDDKYKRFDMTTPGMKGLTVNDTVKITAIERSQLKFYKDSVVPVLKKAHNLSFPDINFTDAEHKDRTLSDFDGTDVIINYTYLYCTGCVNRIDSTLKHIDPKKTKMIVLISDIYVKEIAELQRFGTDILAGSISAENLDLISLKQGDDCMYYLNKNRQIEFFDKSVQRDHRSAWLTFLDTRSK